MRRLPDHQTFSDAAIELCLTLKVLFHLPLRQTTGLVQSLMHLSALTWPVPDYSTLCRRQQHITVKLPYRRSSDGLHLLIDSTGIKMMGEGANNMVQRIGANGAKFTAGLMLKPLRFESLK